MLDLAFIRNHPDIVKEAARVKNNPVDIDYLLEVDQRVLELQRQVEDARAEQNRISKRIREVANDKVQRDALIAEGKLLAEQIKALEPRLHELEEVRQELLYLVPNIPDPSAPIGKDESDNVPIRYWGEQPTFDFEPLDHYALMQKLDVVDIERAVKIAGARSYALKGDAARLELALMNFAMDRIARKGFTPLIVPAMELPYRVVNVGTGDMGDGKVGMYDLECWIPSEGRSRETHSCSSLHDWQARRVNIRYRDEEGKLKFVHTLNNTALASPRILLPLFEVHQQLDGSVRIPAALRPYMGGQEYIRPPEKGNARR